MTCKEFEKLIPDFLNHKMDFLTLNKFSEHMRTCEDCHEELVIQFLVTEGMQRLEEGDAFDLQKELDRRLEEAEHRVRFHSLFLNIGRVLKVITILAVILFVIWILI